MAPTSPEEHIKFLVSCIRFSEAGKVDFAKVAEDCSIISAGAAAKRYSRLLKSIDTNSKGDATPGDQEDQGAVDLPKKTPKRKAPATPKVSGKKSKVTKDDAVMAAENFVETCLEPTKEEETEADLYLFGTQSE